MKEIEKKSNIILFKLISKSLFNNAFDEALSAEEIEQIYQESCQQTIAALVFDVLPTEFAKVNPKIYEKWQNLSMNLIGQNANNCFENAKLSALLNSADIKHCIIKGLVSASYYPKPYLRQMGDIDFLVKESDVSKVTQLLEKNGFKRNGHEHAFHIGFSNGKTIYEMHTKVTSVPEGKEKVLELLNDTVSDSTTEIINNVCVSVPDKFSHGMIMLLHIARHIEMGDGIGLRHLCDWAVFVNSLTNEEFTKIFELKLKKAGLWKFARILSQICIVYLGMPPKAWVGPTEELLVEKLINDFLQSGNFGRKDETRAQSSFFVNRSAEKSSAIKIFFASMKRQTIKWKPFYKKYPFLLPVGYVGYSFRIFFQVVTGKKKMNLLRVSLKGSQRNEIYENLDIFDSE